VPFGPAVAAGVIPRRPQDSAPAAGGVPGACRVAA
jgi:hypothetical protein